MERRIVQREREEPALYFMGLLVALEQIGIFSNPVPQPKRARLKLGVPRTQPVSGSACIFTFEHIKHSSTIGTEFISPARTTTLNRNFAFFDVRNLLAESRLEPTKIVFPFRHLARLHYVGQPGHEGGPQHTKY